ncbi:hypothetical protein K2F40_14910 [Clostridium sp. CM028]|uniref:hypothetical protein n=1 Tax=unclassified Clostridium TaxID=2614128 RepID=UPI001C6E2093|nr:MULTISPECIES: hypothetical protein [unclassified Clostridium]MBW9146873.1 hypothetical protein [Clostridium sp. CM027]MBW9150249.1 hypothetical protein [Clostridium sp. CM028]UVE42851.1 hypothetical protein KTC92_18195 [Clostridium sp. CM027]WLC63459.1 hypothetical protein KTC94_17170 [Clostridium sp. CM028]
MSNPKKIDLPIKELKKITLAINENTIANKSRSKEDKITTDKFIKQFGINRKNFSETIKDTNIKYNKSTFFYDIGINEKVNVLNTKVNLEEVNKSSEKINYSKPLKNQEVYRETTGSNLKETKRIPMNTFGLPSEFKEILSLTGDLKEMLGWYRKQTNTNIIELPELNINNPKLSGEVVTRSFKMYKEIAEEFSKFAENKKETQKDLISLALVEFINKYKR